MNPYDEGLACEHDFLVGPPCGEPATYVTGGGHALCDVHFDAWLNGQNRAEHKVTARRIAA